MFHTPVSISAPHTYISTGPFLPSQSRLSTIFNKSYTRRIRIQIGQLMTWPAPPLQWNGHTDAVNCLSYSPNGCHIVTGSNDRTIRIWDAEMGTVVGEALQGHTGNVESVAYSPDGRHITAGSRDRTIRIWDAKTGSAVGKPLKGHTDWVRSIAYSPNGLQIISGSDDLSIRIWDSKTGVVVVEPLEGHISY